MTSGKRAIFIINHRKKPTYAKNHDVRSQKRNSPQNHYYVT